MSSSLINKKKILKMTFPRKRARISTNILVDIDGDAGDRVGSCGFVTTHEGYDLNGLVAWARSGRTSIFSFI